MNANEREWGEHGRAPGHARAGRLTDDERLALDALAREIIGAAYEVSNTLGVGFLEKVYERALVSELSRRGLRAESQAPIKVFYKGAEVGDYRADVLVEGKIIVEVKYVDAFAPEHLAQCLNYLRATGLHLGLLVNFSRPKADWKRVVYGF